MVCDFVVAPKTTSIKKKMCCIKIILRAQNMITIPDYFVNITGITCMAIVQ